MALNTGALQEGILDLLTDMENRNEDAKAEYASRFANLIKDFVMTGKVQVGISVSTSAGAGATTSEGSIL